MHRIVEELEERIFHHSDRPEIEMRILHFLAHALSPTTAGIANEMRIGAEAATVHLHALWRAKRIWAQPATGNEMAWNISEEGRRFLASTISHERFGRVP